MKTEIPAKARPKKTKKVLKYAVTGQEQPPKPTLRLTNGNGTTAPGHERVQEAAYFNYINEGRPEGRALQHWLNAEQQLKAH